jgi:hypothetical protein
MKVILMKVVDIDFQNTVIPYFHRMPLKRKTKHMALDGIVAGVKTKDQIREIFREVIFSSKDFSVTRDFQARHTEDALRCTQKNSSLVAQ